MNERIKELAAQANFGSINKGSDKVEFDSRLDKFAQLIVKDCAGVCERYSEKVLKYSQFGSNAADDCANLIKEHFGVK